MKLENAKCTSSKNFMTVDGYPREVLCKLKKGNFCRHILWNLLGRDSKYLLDINNCQFISFCSPLADISSHLKNKPQITSNKHNKQMMKIFIVTISLIQFATTFFVQCTMSRCSWGFIAGKYVFFCASLLN